MLERREDLPSAIRRLAQSLEKCDELRLGEPKEFTPLFHFVRILSFETFDSHWRLFSGCGRDRRRSFVFWHAPGRASDDVSSRAPRPEASAEGAIGSRGCLVHLG